MLSTLIQKYCNVELEEWILFKKKFKYILLISKNNWSEIDQEPARFENCVASHLLKLVHFLQDYEGYKAQLYYLRSIEKKEVDFLVTIDKKPWFTVEAKSNDTNPSPHLYYFTEKLKIPFSYQVVKRDGIDSFIKGVRIVSADRFLGGLI